MRERRSGHKREATLADGYRSIPALKPPRTREEIAAAVADEWIGRECKRIEQGDKVEHVMQTLAKLRDQGR